ncbi:MAG: tetratricopeptide repeat protein [Bacteroidota bacterium]
MLLINFYLVIAWVFGSVSGPCPEGADWKISPFSIGALKQLKQNLFNYFEQLHFIFFPCFFFVMRMYLIYRIALLFLVVFSGTLSAQESVGMLKEQATMLIQSGKPRAAMVCYDKLLAIDSADYALRFNKGVASEMCDDYAAAEVAFAAAIRQDSLMPEAWYKRGCMRMKQHKLKEAIQDFDRASRLDPENAEAWFFAGKLLLNLDMLKSAISHLHHAIELNPSDASAFALRGRSFALLGDTGKAMHDLKVAVRILPLDPTIRYYLAGLLIQKKRFTEAIQQLDTITVIDSDFLPEVFLMNHYFLFHTKMQNMLHAYYRKLLKTSSPPEIYARKVHVYLMLGFHHSAFNLYKKPVLRERLSSAADYLKAVLYFKIGKSKEAESILNILCEEKSAPIPEAFLYRGRLYSAKGKQELACRDFFTYRKLMKENPPLVEFSSCKTFEEEE